MVHGLSSTATTEQRFTPNSKAQREFMQSTTRQLLYSGSFGAGKSRAGCEKGYMLNLRYPGNRGLIVRKSLVDVRASTINQSLLEDVIPEDHIVDHNKGDCVIKHITGETDPQGDPVLGEVHYYGLTSGESRSSDDLPRKIGSTEFGWIFVDEGTEISKGGWNQLLGRLRHQKHQQGGKVYNIPIQQIFTATNPDSPAHWMYNHFGLGGSAHANRAFWSANLQDNKENVPDEYIRDLESSLSGMYYERYVKGRWVGAEGMVFDEYDPDLHLLHPEELNQHFGLEDASSAQQWTHVGRTEHSKDVSHYVEPPDNWRIYRTFDFGYRNPFVCQFWARSPDNAFLLFREIYKNDELVEDLVPLIHSMTPDNSRVEMSIADHDPEEHEKLQREGISTINAEKDITAGIQSVKEHLKPDNRGRPQLYFMQGARCHKPATKLVLDDKPLKTVDEIHGYEFDEDDEEPIKEDDHGMDAMRYLIHTIDGGSQMSLDEMEEWESVVNDL